MDAIKNFMAAKKTAAFKRDKDKFYDYPIDVNVLGDIHKLYIQDVSKRVIGNVHLLEVVGLFRYDGEDRLLLIQKMCTLSEDCKGVVDWDNVICSTTISWQSLITDKIMQQ